MARYQTVTEESDSPIAKLTLTGWTPPANWPGDTRAPETWPTSAVEALIYMFEETTSAEAGVEGIAMPDCLGWHIATLIEEWANLTSSLQPPDKSTKDPDLLLRNEKAVFVMRNARTWYGQGLNLYNAYFD